MSKRVSREGKRKTRKAQRKARKLAVVSCALLCLMMLIAGVIARRKVTPSPMMAMASSSGGFTPNSPSKEYIYAGNRLVATEEPASTASSPTPLPTPTTTPTPPSTSGENVVWIRNQNAVASGSNLTKTQGASRDWDAGAVSSKAIESGDGYIEFTAEENNTDRMCGLSNGDTDAYYTDIDYALHLEGGGYIKVWEKGNGIRNPATNTYSFGTFQAGDRFRVAIESGVLRYRKNGNVFYEKRITPIYPLLFDTSLCSINTKVSNAVISGRLIDAFPSAPRVNVALSSNGATASASSIYSQATGYTPSTAIDGNRKGSTWWADGTSMAWPDWLEVQFAGSKTLDEIDIIGLQNNYTNPSEPTPEMTSRFVLTDFTVEYWNGSAWAPVPSGNVTSNDRVWRKFTFSPITTSKIRIYITNVGGDNNSQIVELEAYQR